MTIFRHRGYFLLAVLTITLAAGANVVVFSLVNALWLRPQPVGDSDRLVVLMNREHKEASGYTDLGLTLLRDTGLFQGFAGEVKTHDLGADLQPHVILPEVGREVETAGVTPGYFSELGLQVTGRDFTSRDDQETAAAVAIISHRLWTDHFGGRIDLLGREIAASPEPVTIVGIAPAGFLGPLRGENVDLWLPHHLLPRLNGVPGDRLRSNPMAMVTVGRLAPGLSIAGAQSWLSQGERRFFRGLDLVPVQRMFGAPDLTMVVIREHQFMTLVALTAALVLAGGCCTLMALTLVHYERRRRELAIRSAVGASRMRLISLLALELIALLAAGTVSSLLAASWMLHVLPHFQLPGSVDFSRLNLSADWRVYAAAIGACVLAVAASAAVPVLRVTRWAVSTSLVASGATAPPSSRRLRRLVLAIQAAVATVLLVTAGLLVQTVRYGFARGPGFDVNRTLFVTVQMGPPMPDHDDARAAGELAASLNFIARLEALPGVESVALGEAPLGTSPEASLAHVQLVESGASAIDVPMAWVSAGAEYLDALGVRPIIGRSGTGNEAVVTASLAAQLWPDESPIGQPLKYGPFTGTVVGVVDMAFGSIRLGRPAALVSFDRAALLPLVVKNNRAISLVVRGADPDLLRAAVSRIIREVFPAATFARVVAASEVVENDLARERMAAWFFSGFGLIALVLGVGGVFGLIAYSVDADRREYGIMIAIGAQHHAVMRQALWSGVEPVVIGALGGLIATVLLARTLESYLMGISGVDPATYAATVISFVVCATVAGLIAAVRLRRISPMDVLRSE